MPKSNKSVIFFDVLAIGNSNAFGQEEQAIKKVNLDRFRNLGKKKSQIRHLYIQGPKWPKHTKIPKSSTNGQIVPKCRFLISQRLGTQVLLARGSRRSKKSFLTDLEILAKKNLKLGTDISKAQYGEKNPNTQNCEKWPNSNKSVISLMS